MAAPNWRLAGEGNANIVLTYMGEDPNMKGLALRYAKGKSSKQHDQSLDETLDSKVEDIIWGGVVPSEAQLIQALGGKCSEAQATAMHSVKFIKHVLGQDHLLGPFAKTMAGVPVRLPQDAADVLSAAGVKAEAGTPVLLVPNTTSLEQAEMPAGAKPEGPVICMELKMKWGFLPSSPYIVPGPGSAIKKVLRQATLKDVLHNWPQQLQPVMDFEEAGVAEHVVNRHTRNLTGERAFFHHGRASLHRSAHRCRFSNGKERRLGTCCSSAPSKPPATMVALIGLHLVSVIAPWTRRTTWINCREF